MRLLLDTRAFLWWLSDDRSLGPKARTAIARPESTVFVSAASVWEIAVKRASGRLTAPGDVVEWIEQSSFADLPIEAGHAAASAELPWHHADPFDRLLVAQAQLESLTLVTGDEQIEKYGVAVLDAGA